MDLNIRRVDRESVKELKREALEGGESLRELAIRRLGIKAEEQVPPETMHPISPAAMAWLAEGAPGASRPKQPAPKKHNPKTCKIYKCGMCAVQGDQK